MNRIKKRIVVAALVACGLGCASSHGVRRHAADAGQERDAVIVFADAGNSADAGPDCPENNSVLCNEQCENTPTAWPRCTVQIDCDCFPVDRDGDGYESGRTMGELDCNDHDPSIHPGAPDGCIEGTDYGDRVDNDCDGEVDDGLEGCQGYNP